MKFFAVIIVVCSALALVSCGNSSTGAATAEKLRTANQAPGDGSEASGSDGGYPARPHVAAPSGPPPKHLVVKDLKKGTGAEIKAGKEFSVRYVSFDYGTGELSEDHWGKDSIFRWTFGPDKVVKAWAKGLPGMKVGGRRELIAPSQLAYGFGAMIWVVELLSVGK